MADFPQSGRPQGVPQANVATMANWAGAVVSVALVIGVSVWGYRLLVRDVTGIPVVEAAGGPMRVAPEDPGGRAADHQGLSVNSVAGTGTAAPPADRLVLAPKPVGLTREDQPLGTALQVDSMVAAAPQPQPQPEIETFQQTSLEVPVEDVPDLPSSVEALADLLASNAQPLGDVAPEPEVKSPLIAQQQTAPVAQFDGGVARSLRPKVRPSELRTASLAPVPTELAAQSVPEVDPASIPAGTRLVQLGAFDSEATARSEWERLDGRFGEFLEGKSRVIQKASSGGRTFFRLRVLGFADMSDARRFCAALVAGRAECIPVVSR